MLRHVLAPMFEPASLVVIADRLLPVTSVLPSALRARTTVVQAAPGAAPELPAACAGVAEGLRPDLALVCVAPGVLPETLR
ncbi:hypothetical protein, partial [Bordetella pertussis]